MRLAAKVDAIKETLDNDEQKVMHVLDFHLSIGLRTFLLDAMKHFV